MVYVLYPDLEFYRYLSKSNSECVNKMYTVYSIEAFSSVLGCVCGCDETQHAFFFFLA